MSDLLFEDLSPNGSLKAVVEQDERSAYLYLVGADEIDFGMRHCWLANLVPAPSEADRQAARDGQPPLLEVAACDHPQGRAPLDGDLLETLWLEEGDAVALYESGELLAVIPGWSGQQGFSGYSRDCLAPTPMAFPLPEPDSEIHHRIDRARACWQTWSDSDPFAEMQPAILAAYESAFGPHRAYFAIDGGVWPPKGMARFESADVVVLATIGMALRPQPKVEQFVDDPRAQRRIELAMGFPVATDEAVIDAAAAWLAGQSELPWSRITWIGDGHSISSADVDIQIGGQAAAAFLFAAEPPGAPVIELPDCFDDAVRLLWCRPLSDAERHLARRRGSEVLSSLLDEAGFDWLAAPRPSVA